jgi:hypothetical protein
MRTICCTCLFLLLAAPATAREIFVDNHAGDDRATGQRPGNTSDKTGPLRTIGKALTLADAGDTVVLTPNNEPYHESFSLVGSRYSGAVQPFTIRGNGAILDGTLPVQHEAWEPYAGAVFRFQPLLAGEQELYLDGRPAPRVAVAASARRPPPLRAGQWCLCGGLIYFAVEKSKLPADYDLRAAAWQTGITLYHVDRVVISGLVVQGFQCDGISAFNSARDVELTGVTCRGNGRAGITVGGASTVEISGALLGDNGMAQLLTLPCSDTRVRRTQLLSNTAPGWVNRGGRTLFDVPPVENGAAQPTGPAEEPKP